MKFLTLLFLFSSCTFNNSQVVNVQDDSYSTSDSKIESHTYGKVIFDKTQDHSCAWYILTDDNQKLLPVNWDEEMKIDKKKIIFTFQLSRAPQPNCFKGKMIIFTLIK